MKNFIFFKILFLIAIFILIPQMTKGAILYIEPDSGQYYQGDTFIVEIKLDTEGEYINTVEANLSFSSEILAVQDLSQGNSILTLWIKEPSYVNGLISFIGGVPGGYQGPHGLIGKIAFQPKENSQGSARLIFNNSKVLLNDGKGTEAKLTTQEARFNIVSEKLETPADEWQKELEKDKTPPQPFKIEISKNPAIFEGKYFIIFSTTDKETGIDHYEVKEGEKNWKIATSPYVLENQKLTTDIWVKAVDKAGNEWIEIVKAPKKPIWRYILYLVLALILVIIILWAVWWMRKKKTHI